MTESLTSTDNNWLQPHPKLDGVALIDHLYNSLDGLYPNRWRSAFANQQAVLNWRNAWAQGFAEEGVSMSEIKRGLSECRRRFDWPPSFAEFLSACRPPIDPEATFYEAVEQMRKRADGMDRWSSPKVYWAAVSLGSDLMLCPYAGLKNRWRAALERAGEEIGRGVRPDAVPARLDALPAPGQATVTADEARRMAEELKRRIIKFVDNAKPA